MRHAKHSWVHGADTSETETVRWEDGWERTYADAYTKGWSDTDRWAADTNTDWWSVDGSLLVVLLNDDLVTLSWRSTGGGRVESWRRRVAVDVGVVGDVREPGTARHEEA